ncbi:hypothetical protein [Rhodovulum sp. YEN HP10]|uniref:hypothetical protein n=1 Tax=Rhodovulum sp. HP10 TaxID=3387397 RepID=UPI0039E04210
MTPQPAAGLPGAGTDRGGPDLILNGVALVALLSCLWLIVQLARPGEPHENRFGPVPEA